jgi:hypothetical protein
MNRKERRAADKRREESASRPNAPSFGSASLSIADLAAEASRLRGAGRVLVAKMVDYAFGPDPPYALAQSNE